MTVWDWWCIVSAVSRHHSLQKCILHSLTYKTVEVPWLLPTISLRSNHISWQATIVKYRKNCTAYSQLYTHTETKMLISTLFQLKIHSCSDQRALTFTDTFGSHFSRACCNAKSLLGLRGRAVWGWMRGSLGKQKNDGKLLGDMNSVPVLSDTLRLWGLIPTHLFN